MKPIIGIACDYKKEEREYSKIHKEYYDYVSFNGGIPVLLPPLFEEEDIEQIVNQVDGVMIIGGFDIHPSRYGEKISTRLNIVESRREEFDFKLFEASNRKGKPMYGICYGMQIMNIALKGTLFQDIGEKNAVHDVKYCDRRDHKIMLKPGSFLNEILETDEIDVNTHHHQAINLLGNGLNVSAMAEDGLIEAIELVDDENFMLGVQWHPEKMLEDENQHKIMRAFINRCSGNVHERPQRSIKNEPLKNAVQFEIPPITVVK